MKDQLFRCMAVKCKKQVPIQEFNLETNMCDTCSEIYFLNSFEKCIKE